MKTGTDINLYVCRAEGYPVVEHGKSPLDPEKPYDLTISVPEAWNDNGTVKFPRERGEHAVWRYSGFISYRDLWGRFEAGGQGIKDFCDFKNCPIPAPTENPTFNDFVNLAGVVDSYFGIE